MDNTTKKFYEKNNLRYINETLKVDMTESYKMVEKYLKVNDKILDIGFGSGRDMLYFQNKGYEVFGIDNVKEFVINAKKLALHNTFEQNVLQMNFNKCFNCIWASASLLHLNNKKFVLSLKKCENALINNGIMYLSLKCGNGEFIDEKGRYFNLFNEEKLKNSLLSTNFKIVEILKTKDKLSNRNIEWLNVILKLKE